jgi:hypothetical protein
MRVRLRDRETEIEGDESLRERERDTRERIEEDPILHHR